MVRVGLRRRVILPRLTGPGLAEVTLSCVHKWPKYVFTNCCWEKIKVEHNVGFHAISVSFVVKLWNCHGRVVCLCAPTHEKVFLLGGISDGETFMDYMVKASAALLVAIDTDTFYLIAHCYSQGISRASVVRCRKHQ